MDATRQTPVEFVPGELGPVDQIPVEQIVVAPPEAPAFMPVQRLEVRAVRRVLPRAVSRFVRQLTSGRWSRRSGALGGKRRTGRAD